MAQTEGEETIHCQCRDDDDPLPRVAQLNHTCKTPTKYFPIFKTLPNLTMTKRLETEQIQPQIMESVSRVRSLKEICQEEANRIIKSKTVKSLYDTASEIVRGLLCRNMDTQVTKEKLKEDCDECGPGIYDEDKESYVIGSDVVALFPSIKSVTSGRIIRKRVERSTLQFPGFNYKQG